MIPRWKYPLQEGKQYVFIEHYHDFGSDSSNMRKVTSCLKELWTFGVICTYHISELVNNNVTKAKNPRTLVKIDSK